MKTIAIVIGMVVVACGGSPESVGAVHELDESTALAACEAVDGNTCVLVPTCGTTGDSMVSTFGGSSYQGIPIHPDEVDAWVYAGPHAGLTVKFVTTTIAGVIHPAAYACSTTLPAPALTVTGTW